MSSQLTSETGLLRRAPQPSAASSPLHDRLRRDTNGFGTRFNRWGRSTLVFCSGFFLAGSLSPWSRSQVGPFLLHPYLIPLGLMMLLGGLRKLVDLDHRLQLALLAFLALFTADCLQGGISLVEPTKMLITVATIWSFAVLLRDRFEVALASLGAAMAVAIISLPTILFPKANLTGYGGSLSGGFGNKNTFSLYALPMILLSVHFALDRRCNWKLRWSFGICAGLASIGILSGGNRSGYLGLAVIVALVVLRRRKPREVAAVAIGGGLVFFLLSTFGSSKAFWFRLGDPATSRASDAVRVDILGHAMSIGWHNPLIGVGPPNVSNAISTSVGYSIQMNLTGGLDAHNLYAYLFAGGGFPLTILMGILLVVLMSRPSAWRWTGPPSAPAKAAMALMQSMVILFVVRAWFSEDVWTTPGFPMAFGIVLAMITAETRLAYRERPNGPRVERRGLASGRGDLSPVRRHPDLFDDGRRRRALNQR